MLLKRLKANPGTNNQSFSGKQTHVDTAREDMMRAVGEGRRERRRVKLFRGELGKQWKKYEPNSGRDPKGDTHKQKVLVKFPQTMTIKQPAAVQRMEKQSGVKRRRTGYLDACILQTR